MSQPILAVFLLMTIFLYLPALILGLMIGSFLNCLAWRLHTGEGMMGRSYCPRCRQQIAWYDNLPLLSYVILWGSCRSCRQPILIQYPLVELATGVLFILSFHFGHFETLAVLRNCFLASVMVLIFIIDFRWYLILDMVTLPSMAIVLAMNLWLGADLLNLALSGIIGGGFFLLQYLISQGKWIGGGDIRMGVLMGLALGWPGVGMATLLAYLMGAIAGLVLILAGKKKMGSQLPFGVFLSSATVIVLFWGRWIFDWYFGLF
jgi:leader peptidase (prepilin peptidase) / N-methyltransferase